MKLKFLFFILLKLDNLRPQVISSRFPSPIDHFEASNLRFTLMRDQSIKFNWNEDDVILGIYTYDNIYDQNELDEFSQNLFQYILDCREEMDAMWEGEYNQSISVSQ